MYAGTTDEVTETRGKNTGSNKFVSIMKIKLKILNNKYIVRVLPFAKQAT